jgi:hypothetical protein
MTPLHYGEKASRPVIIRVHRAGLTPPNRLTVRLCLFRQRWCATIKNWLRSCSALGPTPPKRMLMGTLRPSVRDRDQHSDDGAY